MCSTCFLGCCWPPVLVARSDAWGGIEAQIPLDVILAGLTQNRLSKGQQRSTLRTKLITNTRDFYTPFFTLTNHLLFFNFRYQAKMKTRNMLSNASTTFGHKKAILLSLCILFKWVWFASRQHLTSKHGCQPRSRRKCIALTLYTLETRLSQTYRTLYSSFFDSPLISHPHHHWEFLKLEL